MSTTKKDKLCFIDIIIHERNHAANSNNVGTSNSDTEKLPWKMTSSAQTQVVPIPIRLKEFHLKLIVLLNMLLQLHVSLTYKICHFSCWMKTYTFSTWSLVFHTVWVRVKKITCSKRRFANWRWLLVQRIPIIALELALSLTSELLYLTILLVFLFFYPCCTLCVPFYLWLWSKVLFIWNEWTEL